MSARTQASLLFVVEVLCALFLLATGHLFVQNLVFLLIQIFGVLLIFWAVLAGQLTCRKQVSGFGNFWVDKGPYEILRHPIYAGVFLIMSSFVQWQFTLPRLFVFVLFMGVCLIKMKSDEQILVEHFKEEYKHYQERTHKIIPYFY